MHKVFLSLLIVFIVLLNIFVFLLIYPSLQHIDDNDAFDKEINKSVKDLVNKAIRVKYRRHNEDDLAKIFTEEFQQKEEFQNLFKNKWFYFVNKDYMKTLRFTKDNELKVTVRGSGLWSDECNYIIKIVLKPDGTYIISDIGLDP